MKSVPQHKLYVCEDLELGRLVRLASQAHFPLPAAKQMVSLTADPLSIDICVSNDPDPMFCGDCAACKQGFALVLSDGEVSHALFRAAITGEGSGGSHG
jgi:hypothetical protein